MIIMIFSAVFAVILFQTYCINYSVQGLNKAVIFTPVELLYKDITFDKLVIHVDKEKVQQTLLNYYNKILPRYSNDYNVNFYFYSSSDQSMCVSNMCDAIEIEVNATVNLGYKYHRVMYYELIKGANNG